MVRYISVALLVFGVGLLTYSLTLFPYTNEATFNNQILQIKVEDNRSEKYHEIRELHLTPKFALENYGIVCIAIGLSALVLVPRNWRDFKSPKNKSEVVLVGFIAVLLSVGGYVGDLFLEAVRGSYPPWAESIGIPLMGVPLLILIFLAWFGVNLIGLKSPFRTSVSILAFRLRSTNYWYLVLTILTVIMLLILIYEGVFWWTAAGIMWLYFYLALLLGRQR